jgi:hypothetical protein
MPRVLKDRPIHIMGNMVSVSFRYSITFGGLLRIRASTNRYITMEITKKAPINISILPCPARIR